MIYLALALLLVVAWSPSVLADAPPPTPTLAPIVTDTATATQTYQLQEFTRELAYGVHPGTTLTNTTTSGSLVVVERRFTYGDLGVMLLCLVLIAIISVDLIVRVGVLRP